MNRIFIYKCSIAKIFFLEFILVTKRSHFRKYATEVLWSVSITLLQKIELIQFPVVFVDDNSSLSSNPLSFADDNVLVPNSFEEQQVLIDEINEQGNEMWLKVNLRKTKIICKNKIEEQDTRVKINVTALERVEEYVYLGTNDTYFMFAYPRNQQKDKTDLVSIWEKSYHLQIQNTTTP